MSIRREKIKPITSDQIKAMLVAKFRFTNRYKFIATECGLYNADVLAISNKGRLIEVEVKISRSDLRNDFKKIKHKIYEKTQSDFTPHEFYFCVPKDLVEYAKELTKNTSYGVMKVMPWRGDIRCAADKVIILKRSKALHDNIIKQDVKDTILMRMTSELANHKLKELQQLLLT